MSNDKYVYQTHPTLGDKALQQGHVVVESGKKFVRDAADVINVPPSSAAVWLAVLVGVVAWKASKGLLSNFGGRSGVATVIRPVVAGLLAYGAASMAHDSYLESNGIQVRGRTPAGEQIKYSKPSENFERAARSPKRHYDYAPVYGADDKAPAARSKVDNVGAGAGTRSFARAQGAPAREEAHQAERREGRGQVRGEVLGEARREVRAEVPVEKRRHNQQIIRPE